MSAGIPGVQYAGGATMDAVNASRRGVLATAPKWVRDLAGRRMSTPRTTPAHKPATRSARKFAGWVSGVACVGVSRPAYAARDGRHLPEQFSPAGLRSLMSTAYRAGHRTELQWGHNGPTLASVEGLDLTFRIHERYGLCFDARLPDTPLARQVLAELERGLLGVSIAYVGGSGWLVERSGIGTVRVVDEGARLDHIAILARGTNLRPAYAACRASGRSGESVGPARELRQAVELAAWDEIVRQARGVT